jgi:hypothetical protein
VWRVSNPHACKPPCRTRADTVAAVHQPGPRINHFESQKTGGAGEFTDYYLYITAHQVWLAVLCARCAVSVCSTPPVPPPLPCPELLAHTRVTPPARHSPPPFDATRTSTAARVRSHGLCPASTTPTPTGRCWALPTSAPRCAIGGCSVPAVSVTAACPDASLKPTPSQLKPPTTIPPPTHTHRR